MHAHNDDTATDDDLPDSRSVNVGDVDKDDLMPPKRHVADEDDSDDTDQNKEGELAGTPRLADDVGELESVDVEAYDETHIPGIHNVARHYQNMRQNQRIHLRRRHLRYPPKHHTQIGCAP